MPELNKLKIKCSECGREEVLDLPDDEILRSFTVLCKDCALNVDIGEWCCKK